MNAPPNRALVLSDLHIGPANFMTSFAEQIRLTRLLDNLSAADQPPLELILAGDVFDFLQCDGYTGFDADKAPGRMETILGHEDNAPLAKALGHFARRSGNQLTILSGNHDPEVLLPGVREVLARHLEVPLERIRFPDDDAPLLEGHDRRPPLFGRALGSRDAPIWVVHGDRWDPHNAIDRRALLRQVAGGAPVELPIGSHVVFEALREIKPNHVWIDLLKPEVPAVLLVLMYLEPERTIEFLRRHKNIGAALLIGSINGALTRRMNLGPDRSPAETTTLEADLARALATAIAKDDDAGMLVRELGDALRNGYPPSGPTLAVHGGVRRWLARAWIAAIRDADRFQDPDAADELCDIAVPTVPEHVRALVCGHTHGQRARAGERTAYFNSGTWIPIGRLPAGDVKDVLDSIEAGGLRVSAPCTAIDIELGDTTPRITLKTCDPDGRLR